VDRTGHVLPFVLHGMTLAALALLGGAIWKAERLRVLLRRGAKVEDTHFPRQIMALLVFLSLIAVVWSWLAIVLVSACAQMR
jgi:hypothetical protein